MSQILLTHARTHEQCLFSTYKSSHSCCFFVWSYFPRSNFIPIIIMQVQNKINRFFCEFFNASASRTLPRNFLTKLSKLKIHMIVCLRIKIICVKPLTPRVGNGTKEWCAPNDVGVQCARTKIVCSVHPLHLVRTNFWCRYQLCLHQYFCTRCV